MQQYVGILGVVVLSALALAISTDRRRVPWRLIAGGILFQGVIAGLFLRVRGFSDAFNLFSDAFVRLIEFSDRGAEFLFGRGLTDPSGPWGFVFAFKVMPTIVFFSALMAVLYHVGVMQRVVAALAWVLRRTLKVSGAEALTTAANVFLGQTEAPMCVRSSAISAAQENVGRIGAKVRS